MKPFGSAFILFTLACSDVGMAATRAVVQKNEKQKPTWERIWDNQKVDASIRGLISAVDSERMSKHLFHLSKDPLPYRKLNFTLPGHEKSTLHEADDYLAGRLESWGYRVQREAVRVQAFRRDLSKPKHAQYSRPMPDDPWYTACNLYAEKQGRLRPSEILLILAHKDSQSWIDSPGANDNAIGTVSVLEHEPLCMSWSQPTDNFRNRGIDHAENLKTHKETT